MAYTFSQLEQIWIDNGGSAVMAPVMAAIALAESSGNPGAVGDNGTSLGLWQVHYTVHPQFNPSQLYDPNYNANAAIQLSGNGQYLRPWTTWLNGAYRQFMPGGASYTSSASSSTSTGATTAQQSGQCSRPWWSGILGPAAVIVDNCPGVPWWKVVGENIGLGAAALLLIGIGGLWIAWDNRETIIETAKDAAAA